MTTTTTVTTVEIARISSPGDVYADDGETSAASGTTVSVLRFPALGIPAGEVIHSAELTRTFSTSNSWRHDAYLMADTGANPIAGGDYNTAEVGSAFRIPEGSPADAPLVSDVTELISELVTLPGWGPESGAKFKHNADRGSIPPPLARVYTHHAANPDFHPTLTIVWGEEETEQTYRIVGPAGLENVRLVGVTAEGGDLVPVRLVGEYDGSGVQPLF